MLNRMIPPTITRSFLILLFTLVGSEFAIAAVLPDTTVKPLLATLNKKEKPAFIVKEANIVFPAILSGNDDQAIDYIEKFATNRRDYIIRTYDKGKKYFSKAATILNKFDLPHELKMLLALESAFNANAVSKAGAVGYWQFMDETAKEYGLKITKTLSPAEKKKLEKKDKKKAAVIIKTMAKQKDDRRNLNKSTYAAARYLKDRSRNLNNDILLMVASYNCGVGNVWDAMARSGKTEPTFWDIKNLLPAETRAYVMNFITLNVLFNNYDKFASNTLSYKSVKVPLDKNSPNTTGDYDEGGTAEN